jgi:uncharacterized protein (UPF0276 family)
VTSREKVHGVGLGLRWTFLDEVVAAAREDAPALAVDFFEVSPENYMRRGGYVPAALDVVRERWPILTHGLTLSIGSLDPFDSTYLEELRAFVERVGSPFHSDHLCFGGAGGRLVHELLPMPFIEDSVEHVAARAREVRERLGRPLALENITYYAHPGHAEMTETELIRAVVEEADVGLLLDVNNLYVNATNFGFDAVSALDSLPLDRVVSIHVAGHEHKPEHGRLIDTHGAPTIDPVLALLERAVAVTGPVPVVLERDHAIPELPLLLEEVARVRAAYERGLARRGA